MCAAHLMHGGERQKARADADVDADVEADADADVYLQVYSVCMFECGVVVTIPWASSYPGGHQRGAGPPSPGQVVTQGGIRGVWEHHLLGK